MRFCFLLCTVGTRVPALRTCDSTDPAPWCGNNINPWILHHIGVALPRRPPPCVRKCEFFWCFFLCFFVFFGVFWLCVCAVFFGAVTAAATGRCRTTAPGTGWPCAIERRCASAAGSAPRTGTRAASPAEKKENKN